MNKIKSYKLFEMSIPYRKGDDEYNIITAIYNNDINKIEDIASRNGLNWKGRNHTPLEYAAMTGRFEIVKKLVELGADINYGDVLYQAVVKNHSVITEYLIKNGIDPNKGCIDSNNGKYNKRPLFVAYEQKNLQVFDILLQNGADPTFNINFMDYGRNDKKPFIFYIQTG